MVRPAMSLTNLLLANNLRQAPLVRLAGLIDWVPVEAELAPFHAEHRHRRGGPTPFTPLVMFRASLLQDWHQVSFNQFGWLLRTRLDFQIFVGLETGFPVPSSSSVCRARQRLEERGARERCTKIVADQLGRAGVRIYLAADAVRELRVVHICGSRGNRS